MENQCFYENMQCTIVKNKDSLKNKMEVGYKANQELKCQLTKLPLWGDNLDNLIMNNAVDKFLLTEGKFTCRSFAKIRREQRFYRHRRQLLYLQK